LTYLSLNDFPKIEDPDQEFEFELFGGDYRLAEPVGLLITY